MVRIERLVKRRREPPLRQSQTNKTLTNGKELIDNAKIAFYFRLSNTFLRASVAISGVTNMYAKRHDSPLSTLCPRM